MIANELDGCTAGAAARLATHRVLIRLAARGPDGPRLRAMHASELAQHALERSRSGSLPAAAGAILEIQNRAGRRRPDAVPTNRGVSP